MFLSVFQQLTSWIMQIKRYIIDIAYSIMIYLCYVNKKIVLIHQYFLYNIAIPMWNLGKYTSSLKYSFLKINNSTYTFRKFGL